MKIAVIVDNLRIQRFALDALNAVAGTEQITVFSCRNTRLKKRWVRHAAYYALNLLAVRNPLTRFVPISAGRKRIHSTIEFDADTEGTWQHLPSSIVNAIRRGGFDIVLKFGMGLLRVPSDLSVPILSYHHGDPDRYRGRPAAFWEITDDVPVMGQIIQIIGNKLDAGKVVAYAETKVLPWSWRGTLVESYRHSPLIINRAIQNVLDGTTLEKHCTGRNCRLPSQSQVILFAAKMAIRFIRRMVYGGLVEKRWKVSTAELSAKKLPSLLLGQDFPAADHWNDIPVRKGYTFYADPFFTTKPSGILVEALNAHSGTGEIFHIVDGDHRQVLSAPDHTSYPSVTTIDGQEMVLPETGRWSPPVLYTLQERNLKRLATLKLPGDLRLGDPTLVTHAGGIYLFGNVTAIGSNVLYLWSSESLEHDFEPHPASPILVSPRGSRMGGSIIKLGSRLIRLGQDFSSGYGAGLFAFEIQTLTRHMYSERPIARIAFTDRNGPHTLNLRNGEIVFDWYRNELSLFAGLRRLRARRGAKD